MKQSTGTLGIIFNHFKEGNGPLHALNLLIFLSTLLWFHDSTFEQVILVITSMIIFYGNQFYRDLNEKINFY